MKQCAPRRIEDELARLHELCATLDGLSREQHAVLSAEESSPDPIERVGDLVNRRQDVVAEIERVRGAIEAIEAGEAPLRDRLEQLEPAVRGRCGRMLDEIASVVEAVRTRDARDTAELTRRRASVTSELVSLARGKGALSAYADAGAGQPRPGMERGRG